MCVCVCVRVRACVRVCACACVYHSGRIHVAPYKPIGITFCTLMQFNVKKETDRW